jgi:SNF2 family DNA or RNA helicase
VVQQLARREFQVRAVAPPLAKQRQVLLEPQLQELNEVEETQIRYLLFALGIAFEFDPYFGLSISRVDPLPHQLEAVYDHLLKLAQVRFLLADDAGAGKTIMAGLLVRELKLRGLIERVLVVCPANLAFQWQRELKEKFDEKFEVVKGGDLREQYGINQFLERSQVITSLDLAKRDDVLPGLRQVHWDLVIIDEAHRMSWTPPARKTARYALGELLRDTTDHMLMLTATPHKGDPQNFTLFLQLLDPDVYADVTSIRQAMENRRAPFYLRRTKEAMVYFPERAADGEWVARKVFTKRIPRSVDFKIDGDEFELYPNWPRSTRRHVRSVSRRWKTTCSKSPMTRTATTGKGRTARRSRTRKWCCALRCGSKLASGS